MGKQQNEINTEITDLIAHGEHIADDLASLELQLDDKQIEVLTEFVQRYIQTAVERGVEFPLVPEWFE
jgi:hypothetical protein